MLRRFICFYSSLWTARMGRALMFRIGRLNNTDLWLVVCTRDFELSRVSFLFPSVREGGREVREARTFISLRSDDQVSCERLRWHRLAEPKIMGFP